MITLVQNMKEDYKTSEACKVLGVSKYLPFSFVRMIKNLYYREKRKKLKEQFEHDKGGHEKIETLM
jgi:hypothetical protein